MKGSKTFLNILVSKKVIRFSFFANIFPCIYDVHFFSNFNFGNCKFMFLGSLDTFKVSCVTKFKMKFGFKKRNSFKVISSHWPNCNFGFCRGMKKTCFLQKKTLTTMEKFEMWGDVPRRYILVWGLITYLDEKLKLVLNFRVSKLIT